MDSASSCPQNSTLSKLAVGAAPSFRSPSASNFPSSSPSRNTLGHAYVASSPSHTKYRHVDLASSLSPSSHPDQIQLQKSTDSAVTSKSKSAHLPPVNAFTAFNKHPVSLAPPTISNLPESEPPTLPMSSTGGQFYDTPPLTSGKDSQNVKVSISSKIPSSPALLGFHTINGSSDHSGVTKQYSINPAADNRIYHANPTEMYSLSSPEALLVNGRSPREYPADPDEDNGVDVTLIQQFSEDSSQESENEDGSQKETEELMSLGSSSPQYYDGDDSESDEPERQLEDGYSSPIELGVSQLQDEDDELEIQEGQNGGNHVEKTQGAHDVQDGTQHVEDEHDDKCDSNPVTDNDRIFSAPSKVPGIHTPRAANRKLGCQNPPFADVKTPPSLTTYLLNSSEEDSASAAIRITESACAGYYIPGIGVPAAPNFDDLKLLYGLGPPIAREHLSPSMCTRAAMRMRERLQREVKIRELREQINELRRLRGAPVEYEDESGGIEEVKPVVTATNTNKQESDSRDYKLEPAFQMEAQRVDEIIMSPINHSSPLNQSSPMPYPQDQNQSQVMGHSIVGNTATLSMISSPPGISQASVITNVSSSSRASSPVHRLGMAGYLTSRNTHSANVARAAVAEETMMSASAKSTKASKPDEQCYYSKDHEYSHNVLSLAPTPGGLQTRPHSPAIPSTSVQVQASTPPVEQSKSQSPAMSMSLAPGITSHVLTPGVSRSRGQSPVTSAHLNSRAAAPGSTQRRNQSPVTSAMRSKFNQAPPASAIPARSKESRRRSERLVPAAVIHAPHITSSRRYSTPLFSYAETTAYSSDNEFGETVAQKQKPNPESVSQSRQLRGSNMESRMQQLERENISLRREVAELKRWTRMLEEYMGTMRRQQRLELSMQAMTKQRLARGPAMPAYEIEEEDIGEEDEIEVGEDMDQESEEEEQMSFNKGQLEDSDEAETSLEERVVTRRRRSNIMNVAPVAYYPRETSSKMSGGLRSHGPDLVRMRPVAYRRRRHTDTMMFAEEHDTMPASRTEYPPRSYQPTMAAALATVSASSKHCDEWSCDNHSDDGVEAAGTLIDYNAGTEFVDDGNNGEADEDGEGSVMHGDSYMDNSGWQSEEPDWARRQQQQQLQKHSLTTFSAQKPRHPPRHHKRSQAPNPHSSQYVPSSAPGYGLLLSAPEEESFQQHQGWPEGSRRRRRHTDIVRPEGVKRSRS